MFRDFVRWRKMKGIHGGDIYGNHVKMDFSVNVNPLGVPKKVKKALYEAAELCATYPDIEAGKLRDAVSHMLSVEKEYLLLGNGASELFMAVVHAIRPKKTVIPIPSFYGYEYATKMADGEIVYYPMKKEDEFGMTEEILQVLTEETNLLFIANPNNPTGKLINPVLLQKVLCHCKEKNIYVVLDECFIEFCEQDASMLGKIKDFENLIIIRAFTKSFAIPGVRLGYLICSNDKLLHRIKSQLPEWNLSVFAQKAGLACTKQTTYIQKTKEYVKRERRFLEEALKNMGYQVWKGEANFLFIQSQKALYEKLLKKGILIRDCENYRGLSKGYYRIAVKSRADNEKLLKAIGEID